METDLTNSHGTDADKKKAAAERVAAKHAAAVAALRGDRLLRFPDVMAKVGRPRSSIYLMIEQGIFPPGVKIGARAVGWRESVVDAWMASR